MHENLEEMVMETLRVGEHVQTTGRRAATVVFLEVIVSVIANLTVIASWWETAADSEMRRRRSWKESVSSSEG
jgi:hypothetical protein